MQLLEEMIGETQSLQIDPLFYIVVVVEYNESFDTYVCQQIYI